MRLTRILLATAAVATLAAAAWPAHRAAAPTELTVYHSPTCGCCTQSVTYLQANGFPVKSIAPQDPPAVRAGRGVAARPAPFHPRRVRLSGGEDG